MERLASAAHSESALRPPSVSIVGFVVAASVLVTGLVSVLVDGVAGSAVLAVAVWSIIARRRNPQS